MFPPGCPPDPSLKFAVTVTLDDGITNVVEDDVAPAKDTPAVAVVQLTKDAPAFGLFAVIVTVAPGLYCPLPVPLLTVTV